MRHTYMFTFLLLASIAAAGCDEPIEVEDDTDLRGYWRRPIVNIDCDASGCLGQWQWSYAWSPVYPYNEIAMLPRANPGTVWGCDPTPDVDVCKVVDAQGHVGCFRWVYNSDWAVAVAPACATVGLADWINVGNDMTAKVVASFTTGCDDGSLGCPCVNNSCDQGLVCVVADNGNDVCSLSANATPCDHGLDLDYDGYEHDGGCVAECTQFMDHCGPMECSPKDAFAVGFCAWGS